MRYVWSCDTNCVAIYGKNGIKGWRHSNNNWQPITGLSHNADDMLKCNPEFKEITYHQFIMWLCWGEEIK
jgi:hypothetical protein